MTDQTLPTPKTVADLYVSKIRGYLSPVDLAKMTDGPDLPDDLCDGNVFMESAMLDLGVEIWENVDGEMLDPVLDLWNAAYDIGVAILKGRQPEPEQDTCPEHRQPIERCTARCMEV